MVDPDELIAILKASGNATPVLREPDTSPEDRLHAAYCCCTLPCTEELHPELTADRLNQGYRMMNLVSG